MQYPKQELPDTVKWGPEKWAVDYRDKNRINCYDTGTAPCKTACPAHIAVQGYLKLAAQGKYREALQLIKRENPFPAVCGRICNRRCEDACTRGTVDQAVAEVKLRSRQYAKRQLTWLRRNPDIHWILWGEEPNFPQGLQNATEYLTALGLR